MNLAVLLLITYTATSNLSQEDANNAAIAGVAKQIVSQVSATQNVTKSEKTRNGSSTLDEDFFSSNTVKSNLQLKGVKVETVKVDKGYKATATLDMDEFTADIQFHLKDIKSQVESLETSVRDALKARLYGKAAKDLQEAEDLLPEYDRLLRQLEKVYPLKDSHRLLHNLPEVKSLLIAKLSGIKLRGPEETFALTTSEMPEWFVEVSDDQGPLENFPLIATQGRQTLSERRTRENGAAEFLLRHVNFETGPFVIRVTPDLPLEYLKSTGLDQGIEITYKVNRTRYEIQLECRQIANFCSAFETALNKKSIFAVTHKNAPKISVGYSATEKNSLTAGNNVMKSYEITFTANGGGVNFSTTRKGVGKNELDAVIKAVDKIDLSDLAKQLKGKSP